MIFTVGEEGKGEEAKLDPPVSRRSLRRRVNPRTTSGGGVWRRRAATISVVQKAFLVIPDCFGAIL